jgi:hypothetical protein
MTEAAAGMAPPGTRARLAGAAGAVALPLEAAVATGVAASPWLRAFAIPGASVLLYGAAAVSVAVPVLVARVWRRPAGVSYAVSAALLIVVVAAVAGLSPSAVGHGLTAGPTRLLTETLPVTGSRAQLLTPLLLVWLCGAGASEILTRTRHAAPALLAPILAYLAAYAVTTGSPQHDDLSGPLLLAALALLALTRRSLADGALVVSASPDIDRPRRRAASRRRAVGALLAALAIAALGVVVPRLPSLSGAPAALERVPPTDSGLVLDPVDVIAELRDGDPSAPARTLFDVTTSASAPGYFPIAFLDDYDGDTWSFDTTFTPSGGRVPAAPAGTVGGVQGLDTVKVTATIRLGRSYSLPFIPMLDRPTHVSGLAVDTDRSDGMVVPADSGVPVAPYEVTAAVATVTLASIPATDGLDLGGLGSSAELAVPSGTTADIVSGLRYLATITGRQPQPTLAFLQQAEAALEHRTERVDPALDANSSAPTVSRGGTSLAEVISSVTIAHRATPEQFATFFVLMARQLGVPARLATGFRAAPSPGAAPIPAGTHTVTNRQAWTWAEVPVAGIGWVVADPTPVGVTRETSLPSTAASSTPTTNPPGGATAVPSNVSGGTHALAKPAEPPLPPGAPSRLAEAALGLLLLVVLLLAAGPGLAAVRRLLRRRARRAKDPAALAVGAWLEVLDGLEVAGMRPEPGATPAEVAGAATQHFGDGVAPAIGAIGALADRAVCSPARPPDLAGATGAWNAQRQVRRRLLTALDRRQRLEALLRVGHQARRPVGAGGRRRLP